VHSGGISCIREFGVAKSTYYEWKTRYDRNVRTLQKKPVALTYPRKTSPENIEKVLELRTEYKMGSKKITIKARTPQLNGKVERSHRTDHDEFYQLLSYTGDVDLNEKLKAWEDFDNFHRPHFSHMGKTPYEMMRLLLRKDEETSGRV
jgi:hypothetical protein